MKRFWALIALAFSCPIGWSQELTYRDLVRRLTDLEYLATIPEPGNTCRQWSSYDRASQYDPGTGKYVKWDANADGEGVLRRDGSQFVMAEMDGPGCIWRIWSAKPENGHVRIYLDGNPEPAVDLPFIGYFNHENAPFIGRALVHEAASGQNCYVPIPYQKSCRIVADRGWGSYFHFTYETFPASVKVPTFRRALSPEDAAALDDADRMLGNCGVDPAGRRQGQEIEKNDLSVGPQASATIKQIPGPRAITAIRARLNLPSAPEDRDLLRQLVLRITWDDDRQPAVWCPLGDFFGTAPGANRYRSLPLGLMDDGTWYCYWYMPFAKGALLELLNLSPVQRQVSFEIVHAPLTRPVEKLARFHAKWHRDALLPKEPERQIDWTMLLTEGRGRFVGVMLHVWNPRGGWWGEGDEKFFVDGEKFPSTFGTGSEDYFGYAWGNPKLFQNAYHNQTISQNNRGHISVNRWHITDNVPFQKSFEGAIEKYFPNARPTLYAATAFWYLAPGGNDPYGPVPANLLAGYWAELAPLRVEGALEAEEMRILRKTAGQARPQDLGDFDGQWSNGQHLWWTDAKPGDRLELPLPVSRAGRYKLTIQLTKANDYAIVQMYLDGARLGEPVDLYSPDVRPGPKLTGDPIELSAGEHVLGFQIVGANEKARKAYMVGIDYVKLEPAR